MSAQASMFAGGTANITIMHRSATFDRDEKLRWTLTRDWGEGARVCFIGHNPSTADQLVDDPTVKRWIHFARAWGYGGFVAVNLYPLRSSDPSDASRWATEWRERGPEWSVCDDMERNMSVVVHSARTSALTVACWGGIAIDQTYVAALIEAIARPLHCFGTIASGAPIHPMARGKHRVPDDATPKPWKLP